MEQQCKTPSILTEQRWHQVNFGRKTVGKFACLHLSIYNTTMKRRKIILNSTVPWSHTGWDWEQNVVLIHWVLAFNRFFFFLIPSSECLGWSKNEVPPGCESSSKVSKPLMKMSLLLPLSIRAETASGSEQFPKCAQPKSASKTACKLQALAVSMNAYCSLLGVSFLTSSFRHKILFYLLLIWFSEYSIEMKFSFFFFFPLRLRGRDYHLQRKDKKVGVTWRSLERGL